jgi:arylsulfatase A-like enzyme
MSGRLPMRVNQWNFAGETIGGGIHGNMTIIAKKLKGAGYSTHQMGKWHCGQSSADLVPGGRGEETPTCEWKYIHFDLIILIILCLSPHSRSFKRF